MAVRDLGSATLDEVEVQIGGATSPIGIAAQGGTTTIRSSNVNVSSSGGGATGMVVTALSIALQKSAIGATGASSATALLIENSTSFVVDGSKLTTNVTGSGGVSFGLDLISPGANGTVSASTIAAGEGLAATATVNAVATSSTGGLSLSVRGSDLSANGATSATVTVYPGAMMTFLASSIAATSSGGSAISNLGGSITLDASRLTSVGGAQLVAATGGTTNIGGSMISPKITVAQTGLKCVDGYDGTYAAVSATCQ
jgi:hypothetical protein